MAYWWVETDMIDQINKDGFKIREDGKIEVDCLLYTSHATEPDPGMGYKAALSLNEDGSGMKLESLERVWKMLSGNPTTTLFSGVSFAMQIGNCKIRYIKR